MAEDTAEGAAHDEGDEDGGNRAAAGLRGPSSGFGHNFCI
jgi:hypothetical protein